jgi:benzoylformate decarboxylase
VRPGKFSIIDQLVADGIRYMFGNPGTVEQGFLDALEEFDDFHYILTLQETIAVAMADGYARATKQPAVVQLHSGVGLGNGIGMLYQAKRGHAPLVVLAGESGIRYDAMDAQMACDLVQLAAPVTKWATRVVDSSSLLRVLRRAIKMASTPPMGPVFVSLPMDILDALNNEEIVPTPKLHYKTAPIHSDVESIAATLLTAQRPMLIIGDGVAYSGAQQEVTRLAELVGAEVWGADCSEVNMRADHPQFRGLLGHMFGAHSQHITAQADVVLICGTYVFPEVFPALTGVFHENAKVIHIDLDAYEIAKNFPVDLGIIADPELTLKQISDLLEASRPDSFVQAAEERRVSLAALKHSELKEQLRGDEAKNQNHSPLHMSQFMKELAEHVPEDVMIFDEALTSSPELVRYIPPKLPGHYFQTRGGSLGVGIPGALGMKLANPQKTVIGFTGDGGSMYTIQALWTAAHHNIGAKFVICNNRSYQLLKLNIMEYWQERQVEVHEFPHSFDLSQPDIRFDELARALGVRSVRVEKLEEIAPAIREMLETEGPFLIDLVISNEI